MGKSTISMAIFKFANCKRLPGRVSKKRDGTDRDRSPKSGPCGRSSQRGDVEHVEVGTWWVEWWGNSGGWESYRGYMSWGVTLWWFNLMVTHLLTIISLCPIIYIYIYPLVICYIASDPWWSLVIPVVLMGWFSSCLPVMGITME